MSVDGDGAGKDSTQSGEYQNTRCVPMRFSMRFWAYVGYYFDKETLTDAKKRTYYKAFATDDDREEMTPKLRKGDLLRYPGHVSIVHSDKPTCTTTGAGTPDEETTCAYEIIHASGIDCLDINRNGRCENNEPFNRKVVVNSTQLFRTIPTGFGRVKLWD